MTALIRTPEPSAPPLLTAEEFFDRYPDHYKELVRGVVKEVAMPGTEHGMVNARMVGELYVHLARHDTGRLLSNDTFFQTGTGPDSVRGMDVAYISYTRLPRGPVPRGILTATPELIVEVRSPTDLWTELFAKVEEYLAAGVDVVVVLDPGRRIASVIRPGPAQQDLSCDDALTIPEILPGFSVPVSRLFA
jgi:Uma2 family endonuclease